METYKKLLDEVNRSGFPLQIALEEEIKKTERSHGWRVYSKEHSWKNDKAGSEGFIDLLLLDRNETAAINIECKRVQNSNWIFLVPGESLNNRRHAKTFITHIHDGGKIKIFDWKDVAVDPSCPESEFCVVPGQDGKSKPMLERVSADVVEGTEAFAKEDLSILSESKYDFRMYYNVIVTTAKLKACQFKTSEISISEGMLNEANFKDVPYVRFRKQFTTYRKINSDDFRRGECFRAKENTVFIVNSQHVISFLGEFRPDNQSLERAIRDGSV